MTLLVLLASVLIAGVTVLQYKEEAEDYHRERLVRKEEAIQQNIDYVLKSTTYPIMPEYIPLIFKERDKIYEMSQVHNLTINIYSLEGNLLVTSKGSFVEDTLDKKLNPKIMASLASQAKKRVLVKSELNGEIFQSSYTYVTDQKFKPLAILNLPYLQADDFIPRELVESLRRLAEVYLLMLVIAIVLSFVLSRYITRSLKTISDKMEQTKLNKRNEKIELEETSEEIYALVTAYNGMIDELEASAVKLAISERETAWREMAKQVAHEIKNPLTPMRLTVQNFQRKFNPEDPTIREKVTEYSNTLIQQIDTMSSIASAFSNFAKMPVQKKEKLDVVEVVRLGLDIFNENYIDYTYSPNEIIANLDRTQLIRIVTNLVKNGIQAIPEHKVPEIKVNVWKQSAVLYITVSDNGIGIEEDNKDKIFEPKFTTKTSGMGLGLAMVKNIIETYKGTITFTSTPHQGTQFVVELPV